MHGLCLSIRAYTLEPIPGSSLFLHGKVPWEVALLFSRIGARPELTGKWMLSIHNGSMSPIARADSQDVVRRIIWIQAVTIGWMTIEAIFALGASWRAHSPALLAFGGDSAIELLSAVVVYWRFRSKRSGEQTEQLAARITGLFLFALAAYVV